MQRPGRCPVSALLTTSVGSFPKPDYLQKARNDFYRGKLDKGKLHELEQQATREVIQKQEEIGLDILVDGEMYRGDMATYFAEQLEGFKISGLVRSYGNRYYRKPVAVGRIRRKTPITVSWYTFAQSLTQKPIKGMLTGPYTIMDWSFDEYYPSRRAFALDLAEVIHEEAADLEKAGAKYIQIDEPAVSTRPEEIDLAIEAMKIVTKGLKAKTITHICYGDFEKIYPQMLSLAVDQIDLELANRDFALLDLFKKQPFTKEIGLGVLDVHRHETDSKEKVKKGIKKALEIFPPERIYVDPDCGLKTRTPEEAFAKLKVMVEARNEIRLELQGG
ncbi:MAG: methionine synthase [Candidatus Omnitrophica bacterium]|nr:methionine synthase [Candidatus Omnitrophota bacterium]